MIKRAMIAGIILLLSGCAPPSTPPRLSAVRDLVPAQSTIADARAKLGEPSSATDIGTATVASWHEWHRGKLLMVTVLFDPAGRMVRIVNISQF